MKQHNTPTVSERVALSYGTIQKMALIFDKRNADDLAQRVAERLLSNPGSVPKNMHQRWLFSVVRNAARDLFRHRSRSESWQIHGLALNDDDTITMPSGRDASIRKHNAAADNEPEFDLLPRIMGALRELPAQQRRALSMHALGYSYGEIAHITKTSQGTVRSRIHYAREKARKLLADLE